MATVVRAPRWEGWWNVGAPTAWWEMRGGLSLDAEKSGASHEVRRRLAESKRVQMTDAEEEALTRTHEEALTALIVDLGLATEEAQLRAAMGRLLAR